MSTWIVKPAEGASGDILVGVNEDKFTIVSKVIGKFSVSVQLRNKDNKKIWLFTVVYGPTIASQRSSFFLELNNFSQLGVSAWLLCGDFNMVRRR